MVDNTGSRTFWIRFCMTLLIFAIGYFLIFKLPNWVFYLVVELLVILGLYEFFTMLKLKGDVVYRLFGVAIGATLPMCALFTVGSTKSGEVLFMVLACFGLFLLQFPRKDNPRALEAISLTLFGMMYIAWFLSFLIRIKLMPDGNILLAYLLVVAKGGDVSSYIAGSLWGKHPLIYHISPKKTVEGLLGGAFVSVVLSLLFYNSFPYPVTFMHLFLMGGLIGLTAQCGDLSESLIKRYCGVKDSGKGLPGMGGIMDLLDSVLLTAPLYYFHLKAIG